MHRSWKRWVALGLALTMLIVVRPAPAAAPYAGTWAVTVLLGNQEVTICLVKVEEKDSKPEVKVIAGLNPMFKEAKITDVSADAKSLHFTLNAGNSFVIAANNPADKTKDMLGTVQISGDVLVAVLRPTEETSIDPMKAGRLIPGLEDLKKAADKADPKERRAAFKELIEKNAGKPMELIAAQTLVQKEMGEGADAAEIKAAANQFIKIAGAYGPPEQTVAYLQVTGGLVKSGKYTELALEYARKAESQLGESDPPARKVAVLKALAGALKKAGKTAEVKDVDARIAKLDDELDKDFQKNAVPFKTEPYAGRKAKSDRVAVVELFTGAQCPPCVSADVAFDAGLKAYKPSEALFLQYHLHIPGPDPMTNSDSEARQKYYGDEIQGTPTVFVDGKTTPPLGGSRQRGKESFDKLSSLLNEALETQPGAQVKVTATRQGDKVELAADVTDVKKPGDKVRLRFVVVEDVVRFAGRNGQRLHHHVVRAFPGGVEGFPIKEKTAKPTASFSLADLEKSLTGYLEKKNFSEEDRPLKLADLKVVAFVQDDDSKEIIQAAHAAIPGAKE
jgi:hypothetical protein